MLTLLSSRNTRRFRCFSKPDPRQSVRSFRTSGPLLFGCRHALLFDTVSHRPNHSAERLDACFQSQLRAQFCQGDVRHLVNALTYVLFVLVVQQLLSTLHCAAFCPFFSSPCDILYHFLRQLSRVTAILEVAIIKPVSNEKLFEVLDRALKNIKKGGNRVIFTTDGGEKVVALDAILYAESYSHNMHIVTTDGAFDVRMTISS